MFRLFFAFLLVIQLVSCKSHYADGTKYKISLTPTTGKVYAYSITNETSSEVEVKQKTIRNSNKSEFEVRYTIQRDSTTDVLMKVNYDKIRIHTKNGETEMDMDAAKASTSFNPSERMLGILLSADLIARIDSSGNILSIGGYEELGDSMFRHVDNADQYAKETLRKQWNQMIGDGIIRKNMNDFFRLFPDSAIKVGGEWTLQSKQSNELPATIKSTFKLISLQDSIATIGVNGIIESIKGSSSFMGYSGVTSNLAGTQEGEFKIEVNTGMLLSGGQKTKINGFVIVFGEEVPVDIRSAVSIKRKTKN